MESATISAKYALSYMSPISLCLPAYRNRNIYIMMKLKTETENTLPSRRLLACRLVSPNCARGLVVGRRDFAIRMDGEDEEKGA